MVKIETGIDKLVKLVADQKRLSLDEAAKLLGVSTAVVQEWAEFLEEEGLLGVEYSLSKTYLVEKKATKAELKTKEKDYERKKEAFVRKVDSALSTLEQESSGFEEIKQAYNALKADIGDEIDQVKQELDELRHYETLKHNIDQDIIQQKIDYQKMVDDIHRKLYAEEKRYEKVMEEIKSETDRIQKEREALGAIEEKEESLKKRLGALQEVVGAVEHEVEGVTKGLQHDEERLGRLHQIAEEIEHALQDKKTKEIDPLIRASQDNEQKILGVQDSIIKKVEVRKDKITAYEQEGSKVMEKFDKFFKKRMDTEKILTGLETAKAEMQHELEGLKNKAMAFDLMGQKGEIHAYVAEMEKHYQDFEKKKDLFKQGVEKLRAFISGGG